MSHDDELSTAALKREWQAEALEEAARGIMQARFDAVASSGPWSDWLRGRATELRNGGNTEGTDSPACAVCGKPSTYRLGMPEPSWCDEHGPKPSATGDNR